MDKLKSKIKVPSAKVVLIGAMGVLTFGYGLDRFSLLPYAIGFLWGILFTLAAQIWGIYFFFLKMESRGSEKLKTLRQENATFHNQVMKDAHGQNVISAAQARAALLKSLKGNKATVDGVVTIQFLGKKKTKAQYTCALKDVTFYYTKRTVTKNQDPSATKEINLAGAQVRRLEDGEIKGLKFAIELLHPDRKIMYKTDYIYLAFDTEADLERWFFALLTVCVPHNGYVNHELNKRLHERFKMFWNAPESGNWINAIISRFWLNIQESVELKKKFTEKISLRLAEKIEEKNLQDYIDNITIEDLSLGTHPPNIEAIMLLPPDSNGDLLVDLFLSYSSGDIKIAFSCDIKLRNIATVPVKAAIILKALAGKMAFRCSPYPAQRFSISFYEEPQMDFDIDMSVGEKASYTKSLILPKVKELVVDRLKLALIEKFVAPHRKYFRIPATPKTDPVAEHETTVHIKTNNLNESGNGAASAAQASMSPTKRSVSPASGAAMAPNSPPSPNPRPATRAFDASIVDMIETLADTSGSSSGSVDKDDITHSSSPPKSGEGLEALLENGHSHPSSRPIAMPATGPRPANGAGAGPLSTSPLENPVPVEDPNRLSVRFKNKVRSLKALFKADPNAAANGGDPNDPQLPSPSPK